MKDPKEPLMYVEITLNFGGDPADEKTYKMPITWHTSKRLTQEADINPKEAVEKGGNLEISDEQIVRIIFIGAEEGGCEESEDEVGEAIVRAGLAEFAVPVGMYIAGHVTGGIPQDMHIPAATGGKRKSKKRRAGTGRGTATKSR